METGEGGREGGGGGEEGGKDRKLYLNNNKKLKIFKKIIAIRIMGFGKFLNCFFLKKQIGCTVY